MTKNGTIQIVVLGLLCLQPLTSRAQVPTYRVARRSAPIRIEGKLNEKMWQKTELVGDFVNNLDGSKSAYKTEARILYDDNFIYFAFRCVDDNIWATMKRRDEHLCNEEVVDGFIRADQD